MKANKMQETVQRILDGYQRDQGLPVSVLRLRPSSGFSLTLDSCFAILLAAGCGAEGSAQRLGR